MSTDLFVFAAVVLLPAIGACLIAGLEARRGGETQ